MVTQIKADSPAGQEIKKRGGSIILGNQIFSISEDGGDAPANFLFVLGLSDEVPVPAPSIEPEPAPQPKRRKKG